MYLVVGEALIDLIETDSQLFQAVPGGAPGNVAIGLSRLGEPVQLLARFGADAFGTAIRSRLADNGVGLDWAVAAEENTSLALANLDAEGVASYTFYLNGTADWQWRPEELPAWESLPELAAMHFGSVAMAVGPGNTVLESWMAEAHERGGITVSFDFNIRPSIGFGAEAERERIQRQSRHAHILKASEEDLEFLFPELSVEDAATALLTQPSQCIVITRGGEGSTLLRLDRPAVSQRPIPITVVDTVGAGDAFCAGLLAALGRAGAIKAGTAFDASGLDEAVLAEALRFAGVVAALTCERQGGEPPSNAEAVARLGATA